MRLRHKILGLFEKSRLYGVTLRKRRSTRLVTVPIDLWPGDTHFATQFLEGTFVIDDVVLSFTDVLHYMVHPRACDPAVLRRLHSFEWLRDLKTVSTNQSRKLARELMEYWMDANRSSKERSWLSPAWEASLLAQRLSNWITLFDFFGGSASDDFIHKFFQSLHRQYTYLQRVYKTPLDPYGQFLSLKALLFCAATLPKQKHKLERLILLLEQVLSYQILPDGGHISRSPYLQCHLLKDLIDIRSLLGNIDHAHAAKIQTIINVIAPVVRLFRHGDGRIGEFKGDVNPADYPYFSHAVSSAFVDMSLSLSDIGGRPPGRAEHMGYERCAHKSSLLIMNTKASLAPYHLDYFPDQGVNVLDFEWSLGRTRLIEKGDVIAQPTKTQFVKIHDPTQGKLKINRHTEQQSVYMSADYDQDFEGFTYRHQRELYLPPEEGYLRGNDTFTLSQSGMIAVRFFFHRHMSVLLQANRTIRISAARLHKKTRSSTKEELVWILSSSGIDEIICEDATEAELPYVCLLTHIKKFQPHVIKWGFQLHTP